MHLKNGQYFFYKKNKKIDTFVSYKKNKESIKKCADMNELSITNNKTFFYY